MLSNNSDTIVKKALIIVNYCHLNLLITTSDLKRQAYICMTNFKSRSSSVESTS